MTEAHREGPGSCRVFHCPYCGDEELTPHGESADGWRCGACLRAFTVRLIATGVQE